MKFQKIIFEKNTCNNNKINLKNKNKNKKPEGNSPSNADKSPVERLSLNRSQCGGYSTKYNTLTET